MLEANDKALLEAAAAARQRAHAPYSHYLVGSAVRTPDGQVFTGCNVENASYGLTNCAERTAMFSAVAAGHREFIALAVVAEQPVPFPCGACRQVMSEFCGPDFPVLIASSDDLDGAQRVPLGELLPHSFRLGER